MSRCYPSSRRAVDRLVELAKDAEVDLVVIAGDLYDRAIPPADATNLFNEALVRLHDTGAKIVAIAGNHGLGPARVAVADQLLEHAGVTIRGDVARLHRPAPAGSRRRRADRGRLPGAVP